MKKITLSKAFGYLKWIGLFMLFFLVVFVFYKIWTAISEFFSKPEKKTVDQTLQQNNAAPANQPKEETALGRLWDYMVESYPFKSGGWFSELFPD